MKKKPDFLWYKLNQRGEERFKAIKETVKKYNPDINQRTWYNARIRLVRDIAPPGVFSVDAEIDGLKYRFSQRLHFTAFMTSWVKNKGFVTRARKFRGLK